MSANNSITEISMRPQNVQNSSLMHIQSEHDWWFAEARKSGSKYYVRGRKLEDDAKLQEQFPTLVTITWDYASNSEGMPNDQNTIQQMEAFETLLVEGIEKPGIAVKTGSITGGGQKAWDYYAKDGQTFIQAMNKSLANCQAFPVDVSASFDPGWLKLKRLNAKRASTTD